MMRRRPILGSLLVASLFAGLGCAVHPPRAAFRASVWIGDRGISIPLPPPSLFEAPTQDVDVQGEVMDSDELQAGATVHVSDLHGEDAVSVELAAGQDTFVAEGLRVDLTDNCLELWLEDAEGAQSERRQFTAEVNADGQTVVVREGC